MRATEYKRALGAYNIPRQSISNSIFDRQDRCSATRISSWSKSLKIAN